MFILLFIYSLPPVLQGLNQIYGTAATPGWNHLEPHNDKIKSDGMPKHPGQQPPLQPQSEDERVNRRVPVTAPGRTVSCASAESA